ncbi:MAG: hypothetical protein IPP29_03125 [Bacteroidetes bacterium]|nr:hypothetical protein [Bacteroidota bacterium]
MLKFYEAGDAIYVAASMLDKEIHPQYVAMRKAKPLAPLIKLEDEYSLVPNPANIFFYHKWQ